MNRFILKNGIIVLASLLGVTGNAFSAEVQCNTTLYFCSYNSDDIVTITTTQAGKPAPTQGFGVYLNYSQAKVNDLTIITSGRDADGIRTNSDATMFRANRLTIKATGSGSDGINLSTDRTSANDGLIYIKDFADIEVKDGIAVRANNFRDASSKSLIILPDGTRVRQTGTGTASNFAAGLGYGVYAGNRDRDTNGIGFWDALAGKNNNPLGSAYVFMGAQSDIATAMDEGHAVYANKGGLVQLGDRTKVVTTGDDAYALYASREQQGDYADNIREGYIFLAGGVALRAENSAVVMKVTGEGSIIASKAIDTPVIADDHKRDDRLTGLDKDAARETSGVFDIVGIMEASNYGTIALNMSAGSQYLGSTTRDSQSTIKLNIAGKDSIWKMDADSNLSNLNLSDGAILTPYDSTDALTNFTLTGAVTNKGGIINLSGTSEKAGNILTLAGSYKGDDGQIILNTVLEDDLSTTDLLKIDGDTEGSTRVKVVNKGGAGAQTTEGIKIIEVTGKSEGEFTLVGDYTQRGQQAVTAGAYAYMLYQNGLGANASDGNWYLRSELKDKPRYQPGVPVYEIYPQFLLGMNALPTLQQRVGNRYWNNAGNAIIAQGADAITPYAPAEEAGSLTETNGIWGRVEGSYNKVKPHSSTSDANYDYNIFKMQAGLDGLLHETENGRLIGGLTVHYTHGLASIWSPYDADLGRGRISTDGYGFGGTLTWYGDDGLYIDNQAQLTWYKSDLSYQGGSSVLANNNNGFGYALSTEIGKRYTLNEHWSLTPQAQLQYSHVNFDSFTDVFGADVSRQRGAKLEGRVGLSVDYQNSWQNAQGTTNRTMIYGIANIYNDFLNGTKVNVSDVNFYNKSEPLRAGIGIGGSYNWNNDKVSLYGEGSVSTSLNHFGDSYAYKGTIGLRVKW